MTKQQLTFTSTIKQNGQVETITQQLPVARKRINGKTLIRFKDDHVGQTTITCDPRQKRVTLLLEGGQKMVFAPNAKTETAYHLSQLTLSLTIETTQLSWLEDEEGVWSIHLAYSLWQGSDLLGKYVQDYRIS